MRTLMIFTILVSLSSLLVAKETKTVTVFYKNRKPSLQTLSKVDSILTKHTSKYTVERYDIEDEKNLEIMRFHNLPDTHFPFAVLINGKFTANINEKQVSFIHFPDFMKGIGRHEGNWSIADFEKALINNDLLNEVNIFPILDEDEETSECED